MVFAGSEGRWKYEDGIGELPMPMRPVFGAGLLGETWRVLRWGRTEERVVYALVALARGRRALAETTAGEAMALVDDNMATRAAASKVMIEAQRKVNK